MITVEMYEIGIPDYIEKDWSMFQKVPNASIEVQVTRKRLNYGWSYGLEIPVIYLFYGQEKLVN